MTKTIIAIYLIVYPLIKIVVTSWLLQNQQLTVPLTVTFATLVVCIAVISLTIYSIMSKKKNLNLRIGLGILALLSIFNISFTLTSQIEIIDTYLLWTVGTFFDPLLFLISFTFKIQNTITKNDIFTTRRY